MSGSRSPPFVSPRPRLSCEQLHDDEEEEEEDEDDEGDEGDEGARARSTPKLHSGLFSSLLPFEWFSDAYPGCAKSVKVELNS